LALEIFQANMFAHPSEEGRKAIFVQHVIRFVRRYMLLQQPEAVRMDCPDETTVESSNKVLTEPSLDPLFYTVFKFFGSPFGECERHECAWRHTVVEEISHPLRYNLRLAGAGRRNNLQVRSAVAHRL
jgi:hypothetical protein